MAVRFFVAKRAATDAAGRSAGGHGQPAGGRLARAPAGGGGAVWTVGRDGMPTTWDLLTQRWTCHLAPATQPALATILQSIPTSPSFNSEGIAPPSLGNVGPDDLGNINGH